MVNNQEAALGNINRGKVIISPVKLQKEGDQFFGLSDEKGGHSYFGIPA